MNRRIARVLTAFLSVLTAFSCLTAAAQTVPWTNSLGQVFVQVEGSKACFCIWETRVKDFVAFAASHPKLDGTNWNHALYHGVTPVSAEPDDPVVNVSWNDAQAYCRWLTDVEHKSGKIPPDALYRLPSDEEWSVAAGIGDTEGDGTPKEKSAKLANVYPWGTNFPPPPGAGNFADQTAKAYFTNWPCIVNYTDGFATTAPVGSFKPNRFGIYDLAGNALEWCNSAYDTNSKQCVLRGGAWNNCGPKSLLSSYREHVSPNRYSVVTGFRCVLEPADLFNRR